MGHRPRSGSWPRPLRLAEALELLDRIHASIPAVACRGLCGADACGEHVDASIAERERLRGRGVDLDAPTGDGSCPALSRALGGPGRCTVYDIRPTVCRLWGAAQSMPCPHGCRPPGGLLGDATTLRALLASLETGGHPDAATRAMLERCLDDPVAAGLMARYLRGDRSETHRLRARLVAVADRPPRDR